MDLNIACESTFAWLAQKDPKRLVDWIGAGTLKDTDLTFAAEALGKAPATFALPALLPLARHPNAVVREGVLHGLYFFAEDSAEAQAAIESLTSDASRAVRELASELAEDFRRQ